MKEKTTLNYWNFKYREDSTFYETLRNMYYFIKRNSYEKYILTKLINRYFPLQKNIKLLEIGCAPGNNLIYFYKKFRCNPYGVEYSPNGVRKTKEFFKKYDLDQNNIFYSSVFSKEFQKKYKNHFDAVVSFGFIEHFSEPKRIVEMHINLLKENGALIISIPNFKGINISLLKKVYGKDFKEDVIKKHNIGIMEKNIFKFLFKDDIVTILFCDYMGTFNLRFFIYRNKIISAILIILQLFIDIILFLLVIIRFENKNISPYLIFIGRKK